MFYKLHPLETRRSRIQKYLFQQQMAGKQHFPEFNTNGGALEKKCLKHIDCIEQFNPHNNEKTF